MSRAAWEPEYHGTGVYETKHVPPRYVMCWMVHGGGLARSPAFPTREEAERELRQVQRWYETHWRAQVERAATDPDIVVIDGHIYSIGPAGRDREFAGFGGRQFYIVKHDGTMVETRNLWSGGPIPPDYRDALPDSAEFVNGERWVEIDGVRYLAGPGEGSQ